MGHWYHLTLVAFECNIAFSVTDGSGPVTRALAKDSRCISSGRIGLKSYASGARWRNIRIGPADRTTLQKISGNSATVVIGPAPTPYEMGFTDKSLDRYMGPIKREAGKQHFNAKARSIASLRLAGPETATQATIHGVVTITDPQLYIQDSTGSIRVETRGTLVPVKVGDEVEAQGTVTLQNYTPVLKHATLRLLWSNVPLSPLAVSANGLATGGHDGSFVELTGTLLSWNIRRNGTTCLTFSDDTQEFYVIVESSAIEPQLHDLAVGSRVLIRGIATYSPEFTLNVVPFALLLPASMGLEVIALPSWWSPFHIWLFAVSALLLILGSHILLIRIQRWRSRAVLRERERLALDMHDTLAQSFAGIGFQLQAIRNETTMSLVSRQHIDVAIAMVHSSHEEAKRSISALRPDYLGKSDMVEALCDYANRIINGRSLSITSAVEGHPVNIPLDIADTIFRIGEEAISNAVRHAKASALSIVLAFEGRIVSLTIQDDGKGFSSDHSHVGLGIRGMEKRARDIGASLEIRSSTGRGTSVTIAATLSSPRTISQRLEAVLDFIAGA
jgi:signal transduction histidine kinase